MRVACLTACVLGLLVGCDNGNAVEIDTTVENFCEVIAEVQCHNWYSCCSESEIESRLMVSEPRTELECRSDMKLRCDRAVATLYDSINAGRVTFDPLQLNGCLNTIIAPLDSCSAVVTELPWEMACKEFAFAGTVALGGSCLFNHDCQGAPDSYCGPNQRCTAKPTSGQPCGQGCASAFFCSVGICQPRLGPGAACTGVLGQCLDDLFCDLTALPVPVCAAKQPGGASCSSNQGCESGQCIPGTCAGTTTTCFTDATCLGHCGNSAVTCTQSSQCSTGTCSVGGNSCTIPSQCTASVSDVCVFPITCIPGDCVGDPPVCTNQTLTIDYCVGPGATVDLFP